MRDPANPVKTVVGIAGSADDDLATRDDEGAIVGPVDFTAADHRVGLILPLRLCRAIGIGRAAATDLA